MKNIEDVYHKVSHGLLQRGQPLVADDVYDRIVEGSTQKYKVGAKVDGERFPHHTKCILSKKFLMERPSTSMESNGSCCNDPQVGRGSCVFTIS